MNEAQAKAKRRLTYVSPENAYKVLCHDRYWSMEFLELYLRRCESERFENPRSVLKLLAPAQQLVGRVCGRGAPEEVGSCWRIRMYALEGETAAWAGEREVAESALARSIALLEAGKVPRVAVAELFRRRGATDRLGGRADKADTWLRRAIELYPQPDAEHPPGLIQGLAEAMVLRGSLGKPGGIPGLAAAVTLLRPSRRAESLETALMEGAVWWLHRYLPTKGLGPVRLEQTLSWLRAAAKHLSGYQASWSKAAVRHAEGRLLQRMGIHRLAERRLNRALLVAESHGQPEQIALCALDLAYSQLLDGRTETARETLRKRLEALGSRPGPAQLLGLAADSRDPSILDRLRRECEELAPRMGYARFVPLDSTSSASAS